MPRSDEVLAWLRLSRAPPLDAQLVRTALARAESAQQLLRCSSHERALLGLPPRLEAYLRSAASQPSAVECRWLDHPRHHLLAFVDPGFPRLLAEVPACPLALFVDGAVTALQQPQLAVVGTRNPTPQGRENARDFAASLVQSGLVVTSGLAAGIDAEAHRGTLGAAGTTVAVLGTGIDLVYPPSHRALSEAIAASGALVSEFPLGSPARAAHFPQRNRLIAGLSLGTLVVEAALRSGSLITARLAVELGREVFAVPGSIHNPMSRGCHQLIQQGAKLTENAADIVNELGFSADLADRRAGVAAALRTLSPSPGMDKDHKILLDALGFDPADRDTLVLRTGFKPEAVSSILLILELEGYVQAAPGGCYSRVARSP
jgi:DNA processing protein